MSADPDGPQSRVARPGDHLSRIAAEQGFRSFGPLFDDPDNLELRRKRGTPHILADGDPIAIPVLNAREVDRPTDQRHRFVAQIHPLVLRLARQHWNGQPVDDQPSDIHLDAVAVEFNSTAPGTVELTVKPISDRCTLELPAGQLLARIGQLQAASTDTGVRQRLDNLGYLAGDSDDVTALPFRSAIEEFQCDRKLVVDGIVGPATRAALIKAHGC